MNCSQWVVKLNQNKAALAAAVFEKKSNVLADAAMDLADTNALARLLYWLDNAPVSIDPYDFLHDPTKLSVYFYDGAMAVEQCKDLDKRGFVCSVVNLPVTPRISSKSYCLLVAAKR